MALKVRTEWLQELVVADSRWKDIVETVIASRMVNVVPAKYAIISSDETRDADLVVYMDGQRGDHPVFRFADEGKKRIVCVNRPWQFEPMKVEEFRNLLVKVSSEPMSSDFQSWLMEIFDFMDHGETPQD